MATGGLGINLAAKRGTNDFHGTFNGFFTHDDLQWSNIPDELVGDQRLQGNDKADHTQQIFDWSGDLGGPILKDRLWFYGSYGENDIRVKRLNQSSDKTRLTTYTAKLNWQATPNDMVSLFWFQGGKEKIGRTGGAGGLAHLDGTLWDQGKAWPGNPHGLTKLEWSRSFGPAFFLNVKGSLYNTGFSLAPQGGLEDDRWIIDNVQAEGRGTAYGQFFERPQKTATADASYFASGLGGSHEIRFGGGFRRVGSTTTRTNPGLKLNGRYNATSTRVRVWRDASTESEADYWSGYLSDTFTKDRFTVNAGLRFDHQASIKKPSQIAGNPLGNGLLPDVDFAGDTEAPVVWTTVSPRLGLTLALDESRKTVARVSFAPLPRADAEHRGRLEQPARQRLRGVRLERRERRRHRPAGRDRLLPACGASWASTPATPTPWSPPTPSTPTTTRTRTTRWWPASIASSPPTSRRASPTPSASPPTSPPPSSSGATTGTRGRA